MNILIVSDDRHQSGLLRQAVEQRGIQCGMRRIDATNAACSYVHRAAPGDNVAPDLVLFDLSQADPSKLQVLKRIAFGRRRSPAPVVILTSDISEQVLSHAGVADGRSVMFEPTELSCFLKKMQEHRGERFKRALGVMYELGPIMVRLPRSFVGRPETLMA
ncbi:MAG: hypothetical protein QNJ05_17100 [Woeseiaceae bacterium]|nr:hypothetical protein [Woeseiaceae bacterium]